MKYTYCLEYTKNRLDINCLFKRLSWGLVSILALNKTPAMKLIYRDFECRIQYLFTYFRNLTSLNSLLLEVIIFINRNLWIKVVNSFFLMVA